jgi:hypothetical protein
MGRYGFFLRRRFVPRHLVKYLPRRPYLQTSQLQAFCRACSTGYRLPTTAEYGSVAPCILASDTGSFGYYQDIGVAPGPNGCNCKWNGGWCGQLSIDTMAWIAFLMLHDVPEAAVDDLCFAEAGPRMRRLFPADDLCDILRCYTSRHSCKWLGCRRHGYVSPLRLQRGLLWVTCRLHMHRHLLERSHNGYMQCTAVFAPHCISWRSRCITTLLFCRLAHRVTIALEMEIITFVPRERLGLRII